MKKKTPSKNIPKKVAKKEKVEIKKNLVDAKNNHVIEKVRPGKEVFVIYPVADDRV